MREDLPVGGRRGSEGEGDEQQRPGAGGQAQQDQLHGRLPRLPRAPGGPAAPTPAAQPALCARLCKRGIRNEIDSVHGSEFTEVAAQINCVDGQGGQGLNVIEPGKRRLPVGHRQEG